MKTHIFITDSDFSNTDKSFQYILGFQPSLGAMLLNKNKLYIFLDPRYFQNTKNINKKNIKKIIGKESLEISYIELLGKIDLSIDSMLKIINEDSKGNIIIDGSIASIYSEKIKKGTDRKIKISNKGYFDEKRIIKIETEKKYFKKAINIIDQTFIHINKLAKSGELSGKTELQVRGLILSKIFENGGEGESFESIVAFGENSSIPHHKTGETIVGNGPLLIDMGAIYKGYCSDFTRTIWIGEKTSEEYKEFQKIYTIVKDAHINAFENTKTNMKGDQIHFLTNSVIKKQGYEEFFIHGTGHGIGLDIHEKPFISKGSPDIIKDNMVFTIEPGIYLEGKFGIRLEDIVIMENGKLIKYSKVDI